jgi:hypothetical protein
MTLDPRGAAEARHGAKGYGLRRMSSSRFLYPFPRGDFQAEDPM